MCRAIIKDKVILLALSGVWVRSKDLGWVGVGSRGLGGIGVRGVGYLRWDINLIKQVSLLDLRTRPVYWALDKIGVKSNCRVRREGQSICTGVGVLIGIGPRTRAFYWLWVRDIGVKSNRFRMGKRVRGVNGVLG